MKKDKTILVFLLIALMIIGGLMLYFSFKEEVVIEKSDAVKIKEEYESLNNTKNENNQRLYPNVVLDENNVFVKSNENEIIDILNSEGYIYFGDYTDAYSRSLISLVDEVSKNNIISKINYFDISTIKDEIALDDLNEPIIKKQGSNSYYKMLEILDEWIPNYYLINEEGTKIDTLEKYIVVPTIVVVKDGEIKNLRMGTIESQKTGYDELSSDEVSKIKEELDNLFK